MKKRKRKFYNPSADPDGSYTGNRKACYGEDILPDAKPADEPVQDADDL